ncbi:hypothetical protein DVS77_21550 [Mycolicibacterium moriokaense]|nr:hypothetical protein DVS77_21550 [Mycolicibacterium moriokaense]
MTKLIIILGGLTLPDQTELQETTDPNEGEVRTLDGSLHTDYVNLIRSWGISFPQLSRTDYDNIYDVFKDQYENEAYTTFVCDALSINTVVKVKISSRNVTWNGDKAENVSLTLEEVNAIS